MQTSTCNAASGKLPIELIHYIVACLANPHDSLDLTRDTPFSTERIAPGLFACSLVCRAWNYICRPHIFGTIILRRDQSLDSRLSFLHFTSPHLCKYILDLRLSLNPEFEESSSLIPDCLKRFTNLRVLYIDGFCTLKPSPEVMSTLGILPLLSTLSLKHLGLHYWDILEDASDLLPILSACSNTLEDLTMVIFGPKETKPAQKPVCLDALRNLKLIGLPEANFIACPNLESLTVVHNFDTCKVPSWIPASLSKLVLGVSTETALPDLGTSISPSDLSIVIHQPHYVSSSEVTTLIGGTLDRLPHPTRVTQLTIKIDVEALLCDPSKLTDYEGLYRAIQPLHSLGGLKRIKLGIVFTPKVSESHPWQDVIGEVAKAFAPLGDILAVDGLGFITRERGLDVLIRCR